MIDNNTFYFLYDLIYFSVAYCSLLFLIFSLSGSKNNFDQARAAVFTEKLVIAFSILLILLVGFREFNVGTDTGNYFRTWLYDQDLLEGRSDFAFYYMMAFIRIFSESYQVFLLVIASLFYAINYKSLKNFSRYFETNILFVFFIFLSLFFSLSTSINVVRQGLSLSILFLGLSFFPQKKRSVIILCLIASVGFHVTSIIPILLFSLIGKFKKVSTKYYIALFLLGIILSYFNFSLLNISPILESILSGANDRRLTYLDPKDIGYTTGFRLDFVVFNFIFLMLFLRIRKGLTSNYFYDYMLKYYCLSSFVFFMAFQMNFSDRFGLFSWFAIAPLLAPAFNKDYDKKTSIFILLTAFSLYLYFFIIK